MSRHLVNKIVLGVKSWVGQLEQWDFGRKEKSWETVIKFILNMNVYERVPVIISRKTSSMY